jgi:hypothetical protein
MAIDWQLAHNYDERQPAHGAAGGPMERRVNRRSSFPLLRLAVLARALFITLSMAAPVLPPGDALADTPCSGHQLLPAPRPQGSCQTVKPKSFAAPDKKTIASVAAVDKSLNATPDMESNVVIRSNAGATLASKDYSSPDGANGNYVLNAKWSPDSQFFVYSMMSSGGHSPWSFPIWVYSVKKNAFAGFSDMINSSPTISGTFTIATPHTLKASTWKQAGDLTDKVPVSVDLETAFDKLPAPSK